MSTSTSPTVPELSSYSSAQLIALITRLAAVTPNSKAALEAALQQITTAEPESAASSHSKTVSTSTSPAQLNRFDPHWPASYHQATARRSAAAAVTAQSSGKPVPLLFTPKQLGPLILKNRIIVSPMCQYSSKPAGIEQGYFNDWHLVSLGRYALGGAALVFSEATAVEPRGRITPWDTGLWSDGHISGLKKLSDFIHSQGSLFGVQLAHAGRKASTNNPWVGAVDGNIAADDSEHHGWTNDVVAPSAIAWNDTYVTPRALTKSEIQRTVQLFAEATVRADKAGADAIEIHAAHGYLLSSFLSPLSNQRTDEYGGSFENRVRMLLEVVDAVRAHWPASKALSLRISCSEWVEGGWSIADSVRLAELVATRGVDLFDASSGGNSAAQKITAGLGYQVHFAEAVKKALTVGSAAAGKKIPALQVGAVGILVDAKQMEEVLQTAKADWIFVGREFLRDPQLPLHAAQQLGVELSWPPQFDWAVQRRGQRAKATQSENTTTKTAQTATTTATMNEISLSSLP